MPPPHVQARLYILHKSASRTSGENKLHSYQNMGGSPGEFSEEPVMYEERKKDWRMNSDVGEATEGLENEL